MVIALVVGTIQVLTASEQERLELRDYNKNRLDPREALLKARGNLGVFMTPFYGGYRILSNMLLRVSTHGTLLDKAKAVDTAAEARLTEQADMLREHNK